MHRRNIKKLLNKSSVYVYTCQGKKDSKIFFVFHLFIELRV